MTDTFLVVALSYLGEKISKVPLGIFRMENNILTSQVPLHLNELTESCKNWWALVDLSYIKATGKLKKASIEELGSFESFSLQM